MKKKCIAALALAATLASQPAWALATGSTSSNGNDGNGPISSSGNSSNRGTISPKSNTIVSVSSAGIKATSAITSASPTDSTIGVAVSTATTTGQQVTANSKREAVIGDAAVAFMDSATTITGLPSNVVSVVNNANAGEPLNEAVQGVDLTGYSALAGTHVITTKGAATGTAKAGMIGVSLRVPNLISSVSSIQVLSYNDATDQQRLTSAIKMGPATKTVAVSVPGSGTLSVMYKN